jgi:dephospho-CoA kinase
VDALGLDRLAPFEENLRQGRMVRRPETLRIAPYDPTWPAQFERLAGRLRHAAGDAALRVDHVGSTAVSGLPAKDVIDIQLTAPDLATADALAEPLAAAGFPRAPGEWHDTPKPFAPDPADWRKRVHGSADPGRIVHLHVRPADAPGWRVSLLLRDWLRGEADARAEYTALKRRLERSGVTTTRYAEQKEPWFDAMWTRAEQWAEKAGWQP